MHLDDDTADDARAPSADRRIPPIWREWVAKGWWERLATAPRSVLMLDYDGTLAPFVADRHRAAMYAGVAERLLRLAALPQLRMVLVSGRQARELLTLLPTGLRPEIWGSHGREELLPDGNYRLEPLRSEQVVVLAQLDRLLVECGFAERLERKPGSLAIHTRGLPEEKAQEEIERARLVFSRIAVAGFNWLPFDGGIEVRASGCSKADAVDHILRSESDGVVAAYLGDDRTDEDAFRALGRRGLRVLVRDEARATAADVWLRPPAELVEFLDLWWRCIQKHGVELSS